jgi:hypothetical protein
MIVKMFILLYSRCLMMARGVLAHLMYWLGRQVSMEEYEALLSPPLISPITAPSEEQKEHEDN